MLLVAAGVLYVPMLTGLLPMGGDMVALAFIGIDVVTVGAVIVATVVVHGVLYVRRRGGGE